MKLMMFRTVFIATVVMFVSNIALGATRMSNGSGNWGSTSTWQGGVIPTANDDVIIKNGHTVTVDIGATVKTFTIETPGKLIVNQPLTTTNFTANTGTTVTVNAELVAKRLILNSGVVFTMNANVTIAEVIQNSGSTLNTNCYTLTINNSISNSASNVVFMFDANAVFNNPCCGTVKFTNRGKLTANSNILRFGKVIIENGSIDLGRNPNEYNNFVFECGIEFNNAGIINLPGCRTLTNLILTNTSFNPGTCTTITEYLKLNDGGDLVTNTVTYGNNAKLIFNRSYTITSSTKAWPSGTGSNVAPVIEQLSGDITLNDSVTVKRRINLLGGTFGSASVNKLRVPSNDTIYICGGAFGSAPKIYPNVTQINCSAPTVCTTFPTITSVRNGDWNDPTTWDLGRVPNKCDDVRINNGDKVTVPANYSAECRDIHGDNGSRLYVYGTMNCREFYGDNNGHRTYVYGQWNGCSMYLDNGCRVYACDNINLSNCTNKTKPLTIRNGARLHPLGEPYCTGKPKLTITTDSVNIDLSDFCDNIDIQDLSIAYGTVTLPACLTIHGVVTIEPGADAIGSTPIWAPTSSLVINRIYTFGSSGNSILLWPNGSTNVPRTITVTSNTTFTAPKVVVDRINVIDSTVYGAHYLQILDNAMVYICGGQFASAPQYGNNVTTQYCDVQPGNPPAVLGVNMPASGFTGDLIISTNVKLGANVTAQGNVIINSTGILDDSTFTITSATSVRVDSGAVVKVAKSGGLTGSGSLFGELPTTLSCGSTVIYDAATGTQEIDARMDYGNVVLDGNSQKTFAASNYGICGDLIINSNEPTVLPEQSKIILAGNNNQSVTSNTPITAFNMTASGSGTKSISSNVTLTGTLQVESGVTLNTGNQVTLRSTATSDAIIGPLVDGADIVGNICWERFVPGGSSRRRWRFLSMPIQGLTFHEAWQDDIFITGPGTGGTPCEFNTTSVAEMVPNENGFDQNHTNVPTVYTWDEPTATWSSIPTTTSTVINPLTAYRTFVRGDRHVEGCLLMTLMPDSVSDVLIDACGPIVKFDQTTHLSFTPGTGNGWNYVSNPYPAPIAWNNPAWTAARGNAVDPTIYIYDPAIAQYASWHPVAGSVNGGSPIVGKDQSFFIKVNENYNMVFNETYKVDTLRAGFFGKSAVTPKNRLSIKLQSKETADEAVLYMLKNATYGYDVAYDGYKTGYSTGGVAVGQKLAGTARFAFEAIPFTATADTIVLFTSLGTVDNEYTLSFDGFKDISGDLTYLLNDKATGTVINIRTSNAYTFNVMANHAATYSHNRFQLVIINNGSLPVSLTNFTGKKAGNNTELKWTTANESNNSHFIVEHSMDGNKYTALGTVKGNGTVMSESNYSFTHENMGKGYNYYRLRQVDFNGKQTVSHVVTIANVETSISQTDIKIFPVPAKDVLNITFAKGAAVSVHIIDIVGKTVLSQESTMMSADEKLTLNVSSLNAGTYFVNINDESGNVQQMKFIKE